MDLHELEIAEENGNRLTSKPMFLEEGQYFMGEDEMRLARDWEKLIGGNVSVDIHVISWMDEDEFGRNDIFKYSLVIDSK